MPSTTETMASDHTIQLTGDGLRLRAFQLDDAEAVHEAVIDSKAELAKWLSWCHPDYSIQDTLVFLNARSEAHAKDSEYSFAITDEHDGQILGACGINQVDKMALRANLGYWLCTSATGRGVATTATRMVARWALQELGLERVEIVAATGNTASQRVAERAGATREGIARHRLRVHGVPHDAVVFSFIRPDLAG